MKILIGLALLGLTACGSEPRRLEVKKVKVEGPVEVGPKASPEEVAGEVPPLQGIIKGLPLVPDRLVPPMPPPDPTWQPE